MLEGGGMRGLYTAGVLDAFLDKGISFPYVIGVSAGACNAKSYLSGQHGRNRRINVGYMDDKSYVGLYSLLKTGSMCGMDFIFDEIPNRLDKFDYESFCSCGTEFVVREKLLALYDEGYREADSKADQAEKFLRCEQDQNI